MSEFKILMKEVIAVSSLDDMSRLVCAIDDVFCYLEENYPDKYRKAITMIKLLNRHIPWDRTQAEYAVKCMKNKDGSNGEHWTYEQTSEALHKKGYDFNEAEWYVTLNMMYSDYYSTTFNTDTYIGLAHDFLDDEDAPSNKMKRYWIAMHDED